MQHADILAFAGLRIDGRRHNEIRRIHYKLSISPVADGSCYYEQVRREIIQEKSIASHYSSPGIDESLGLSSRPC